MIRTVADLLRVPRARRAQCLSELDGWLAHVEQDISLNRPMSIGPFVWTDDGTGGLVRDPRYLERDILVDGPGALDRNPNDTTRRFRDMSVREQYLRSK